MKTTTATLYTLERSLNAAFRLFSTLEMHASVEFAGGHGGHPVVAEARDRHGVCRELVVWGYNPHDPELLAGIAASETAAAAWAESHPSVLAGLAVQANWSEYEEEQANVQGPA